MTYPLEFIGVDIETPGLEPDSDKEILEIAMIYVKDMEIVDSFNGICQNYGHGLAKYGFDDENSFALQMHLGNGLLKEIMAQDYRLGFTLYEQTNEWLSSLKCTEKPYMFGSSVHFDRRWLKLLMPQVHDKFHYRNIDVSSVRTFMEQAGYHTHQDVGGHRAMLDLLSSFNCYKDMLRMIKK